MSFIIDPLENHKEIFDLLKNPTRMQIFLLLILHGKLSHSELSSLLGRAKSTVTSHMQKFVQLKLIASAPAPAQGSIEAKEYVIIPEKVQELFSSMLHNPTIHWKRKLEKEKQILSFLDGVWRAAFQNYEFQPEDYGIDFKMQFLTKEECQEYERIIAQFFAKIKEKGIPEGDQTPPKKTQVCFSAKFHLNELIEKKHFSTFQQALEDE